MAYGAAVSEGQVREPSAAALEEAAGLLAAGRLVAFPTETVYGLGADGLDGEAVARIFAAKGRPADNPLILHIAGVELLGQVARVVPAPAERLAAAFWPGPLTLVLPKARSVPRITTAGLDTVAVRVPAHPVALALLQAFGGPIAAPSANRSGRPSPTRAEHVAEDFGAEVAMVLDGGATTLGIESTVVDCTESPPVLLRLGALSREAIEAVVGPVTTAAAQELCARSPGLRHRHYAPRARVVIAAASELAQVVAAERASGERVAAIVREGEPGAAAAQVWRVPEDEALRGYARELYAALRGLDAGGVGVIVAEAVPEEGLGRAIMDRLRRAAAR